MKVLQFAIALPVVLTLVLQVRLLQRMDRLERTPAPMRIAAAAPSFPAPVPVREVLPVSSPATEVAGVEQAPPVRMAVATLHSVPAGKDASMFRSFTPSQRLAAVIADRSRAETYTQDLERLAEMKGDLDPDVYFDLLVEATCAHLDIPDAQRPTFTAAMHEAATMIQRLYAEFNDQVAAMGPAPADDKTGQGPWYKQYNTLYQSFVETAGQSATSVNRLLDLSNPRHSDFRQKLGEWCMWHLQN